MNDESRERLLDQALAATFPASDAVSIVQPGGAPALSSDIGVQAATAASPQATVGSTVTYRVVGQGLQRNVTLVAPEHADATRAYVSVDSPVGRGLIGRDQGASSFIRKPVGVRVPIQILHVTGAR
jgi:hypothetical protein